MAGPRLHLDATVRGFDGLDAIPFLLEDVRVLPERADLEAYKAEVLARVRASYTLESVKDVPELRAYRDFFWRVGIDPTKTRPAAEALLRRVLQGRPLPRINTFVDAYNLASMETRIALAAFDLAKLRGPVRMRRARFGETFHGIGMDAPAAMTGADVVCEDDERLVAIYPHRDAEASKVTLETRDVLCLVCGVPGIPEAALREASDVTARVVTRFCGGAATRPA